MQRLCVTTCGWSTKLRKRRASDVLPGLRRRSAALHTENYELIDYGLARFLLHKILYVFICHDCGLCVSFCRLWDYVFIVN